MQLEVRVISQGEREERGERGEREESREDRQERAERRLRRESGKREERGGLVRAQRELEPPALRAVLEQDPRVRPDERTARKMRVEFSGHPPIKAWRFLSKLPKLGSVNSKRIVACHQRAGNRVCKLHHVETSYQCACLTALVLLAALVPAMARKGSAAAGGGGVGSAQQYRTNYGSVIRPAFTPARRRQKSTAGSTQA